MIHQRTHPGDKLYKGEACPKRFAGNSALIENKRTHTVVACSSSFASKSEVTIRHEKTYIVEKSTFEVEQMQTPTSKLCCCLLKYQLKTYTSMVVSYWV